MERMDTEPRPDHGPNRDDLNLFLTLSIPIFVTTVALLSFIVIFGSVAAKH